MDFLSELPEKRFLKYRDNFISYDTNNLYINGWKNGLGDAYVQFKNIPKNKFQNYVNEIKQELNDFENEYDLK